MISSAQIAPKQCVTCGHLDDADAKFCPHCGSNRWMSVRLGELSSESPSQYLYPPHATGGTPTLILPENIPRSVPTGMAMALTNLNDNYVPSFAHVTNRSPEVMAKNQVELAKLMVILARERLFLLFHFGLWASINIVGFSLALKCYNEFIGDELTKIMIGCTPFWIFNMIGLNCIHQINKTRRNIARTKDQVTHAKFKVEYGHLV